MLIKLPKDDTKYIGPVVVVNVLQEPVDKNNRNFIVRKYDSNQGLALKIKAMSLKARMSSTKNYCPSSCLNRYHSIVKYNYTITTNRLSCQPQK